MDDQPILFLGEWCRIYNRKTQWESLDAVIAPYHWDNRTKLRKDYQYLKKLHETFLLDLSNKLNQLHQVNRSLRYWRILIGPWLGYFIQILFDRWTMLKFAIEEYSISGCSVLRREPSTIIPNNMEHFNRIIHEDYWNEGIFGQLLNNYWGKELLIQEKDLYTANDQLTENEKGSNKKRIKKLFDKIIFMTNSLSVKSDEYFFISSYLPYSIDFKLQLSLGQVPKNWRTELLNDIKVNKKMRQWEWDNQNSKDDFAAVVKCMIPKHIPKYYLEGYKTLINRVHSLPWPNKPKAIFTSNAYSGNDVFKAWAAEKTESGVPLVIGQHG